MHHFNNRQSGNCNPLTRNRSTLGHLKLVAGVSSRIFRQDETEMKYLKVAVIALIAVVSMAPCLTPAEEMKEEVLMANGSVELTNLDFEADMLRIPQEDRSEFRASPDRVNKVVNNLYLNRVLAQEARKAGLDKNLLLQKRIQLYTDSLLAAAWVDQLVAQAKIPDFEGRAKELYKAEPEKYTTAATVSASHILISTNKRTDEDALKRAQEVREKALQGGSAESFAKLAVEFSDDPSAQKNNGDLGIFKAEQMVKPFADAAFALKEEGEISQPVKTQFGYHIIRLQKRQAGKLQDFEAIKDALIEGLKNNYLAEIRANAKGDAFNGTDKKVNADAISRLKIELPVAPVKTPAAQ